MFLQEHWLPHHEAETRLQNDFQVYNFHSTSSDMFLPAEDIVLKRGPTWHGTAIGWHNNENSKIKNIEVISERFCGVVYHDSDLNIIAYSAYLPTSGQDDEFLETISLLTLDIIKNMENIENDNKCIIIIGLDSNQSKKSTQRRSGAMKAFMSQFSFQSILPDETPTFHHNNQTSESQIDDILFFIPDSSQIKIEFSEQLCKLNNPENLSAHDVVVGQICLPKSSLKVSEPDYSSTYTQFQVRKPKWDESGMTGYQTQTARVLSEMLVDCNEPFFLPVVTEMFSKMLVISAQQNFECSNPMKNQKKNKTPKFSKQTSDAYFEHKQICKQWREAGRPTDNSNPMKMKKLQSQRKIQQLSREEQSSQRIILHNDLMETFSSNISQVCKKLKQARGENSANIEIPYIETLSGVYSGINVLEGFCSNTEILCNEDDIPTTFDDSFYNMCVEDNMIIFELSSQDKIRIPHMQISELKTILFQKLKLGKACDLYMLTVEHLRHAGEETLSLLLDLLNLIVDNLNYLSSPQLNTSITSIVHKGKRRPLTHHKSFRQVRVSVLIGRLIDEYIRPVFVKAARPQQNINQYGFTANITYLMGALQRHEAEQFCLDTKK